MPSVTTTNDFTEQLSDLLRGKYGDLRHASKRLARMTGRNQDAARNWLEGRNSPGAAPLIDLMRQDDDVFDLVCRMADREPGAPRITNAQREALRQLLEGP